MTAPPAPASDLALQALGLRHAFGETEVLHGLSLQVGRGEVVAVTGPSGSGKSTLLHLLGGLDRPNAGEVSWGGVRIDTLSTQARAQRRAQAVGLVFQHHYLLPDLDVLGNLMVPGMLLRQDLRGRARELLAAVGMSGRERAMPEQLSGGERQRVALARALVARPAILLADEPTGSLDTANAHAVATLLIELAKQDESGVLLVTHDEALASRADRRLHLLDGALTDE
ncbi:ABC transporter ATP-binding protein [Deinococcus sp. KNUC1210]|uniref:ABC transporter ATP-binding protein n=1 Tax=Deinococcus sp. KNUC1210 TaxID=2917691 RepID=UPI001EF10693|nr:ABC transporter ATP-binding protein [Deinococcus sp. KNUC1210]ULH16247.1 ABC transporter ATP-binding protein [Deinococcus sp. KNUC1210]